jgi:hypothetical protein
MLTILGELFCCANFWEHGRHRREGIAGKAGSCKTDDGLNLCCLGPGRIVTGSHCDRTARKGIIAHDGNPADN